jgi:predicted nucleic acid-binding protein
LIPYLRKDAKIKNKVSDLISRNIILSTTSINVAELYLGAYLSKKKNENLNSVEELISRLDIITFITDHGRIYGELKAKLQKRGTIINELDIFIAAIVLERDTTLITRNLRHFEKISGLKIEKW